MVVHRILTAVVLLPIVLGLLFFASAKLFFLATLLLFIYAGWEWCYIAQIKSYRPLYLLLLLICCLIAAFFIPAPIIFFFAFVWWSIATLLVIAYPSASRWWQASVFSRALMGILVLLPSWAALNFIRNQPNGIYSLLFLFLLIWGADTGAFFAGRKWGKTKLAPLVSPGKSVEGLIGALVTTALIVLLMLILTHQSYNLWLAAFALSLITVFYSIVGDLFESMLKRHAGIKDSGTILPGHGGILDRIDSLTSATPIFALGAFLLGQLLSR